jgi:L-lactate dehydrogenase complex protein LldG
MGTDRERLLAAVREAVAAGNRAGGAPPRPRREGVGYQGAGGDPVGRFAAELTAAGGVCRVVPDAAAGAEQVLAIVREKAARRVVVGAGAVVDGLNLPGHLRELGVEVSGPDAGREAMFAADIGVTGVDYLLAETGSLVLLTAPGQPRSASLLPPVHVAVADRGQILPDLFDLFDGRLGRPGLPACVTLITGPSKTGDIELQLVTGVHGPGEVYVVLIDPPRGPPSPAPRANPERPGLHSPDKC